MKINAAFYKARDEFNTYEKHVPAPYLRYGKKFDGGRRYKLTVSGLGFYELYVNGKNITKGLLAPYISNPDDIVYFDEYDVTGLVGSDGGDVIGIILGNGMQNAPGGRVWDFDVARFRSSPRFAALLTETAPDGSETVADIGEYFVWHDSPIIFDDLRSGCFYDARKEIEGWNLPGLDESGWQPVRKAESPRGEYRLCEADPILISEEIKAVEIREAVVDDHLNNRENMRLNTEYKFNKLGQKGVMFDFGVNTAGICRLNVNGRPGQEIYVQFCELITTDGKPSYRNTGSFYPDGYGQSLLYICSGKENETFEPSFCYYGYRCAVVFGLDDSQINENTLVMLRASSALKERSAFKCSDEVMNALGAMSRNSDLSNFYYFPTDCPHREKNGWTGDAAVSAEHMLLTLTPETSYAEWLRNICKAQKDDGSLPGIVPTGGWGFAWGNGPAWDNVLSELCFRIYRMRGDLGPARECADSLLRYVAYLSRNRNERGLIDFGLGDWLQPDRGAGDPVAPVALTSSVISVYIAEKSAELFAALGMQDRAKFASDFASSLRESVRKYFIDTAACVALPRCQTSQAICIYYGIFDPSEMRDAARELEAIIHEGGDKLDCGMIGARVIFHVLSDYGMGELAYKMITREDYPSYGMFVRRGFTALPEDFLPEDRADSPNSLNHHFFGDITSWFIQKVVGICVNPDGDSPNSFTIRPDFIPSLSFAEAFYDAPCGRVEVKWQREGERILLNVNAPDEATGMIKLGKGRVISSEPERQPDLANYIPLKSGKYVCKSVGAFKGLSS